MARHLTGIITTLAFTVTALPAAGQSCRDLARLLDADAREYRKLVRGVSAACDSGAEPECIAAETDIEAGLSALMSRHVELLNTCIADAPPPPTAFLPDVGDLVITESMSDPDVVSDAVGEWVEIFNASDKVITLAGSGVRVLFNIYPIEGEVIVNPGEYVVIGNNGDGNANGNVLVDGVATGMILPNIFSNAQENTVELITALGVIVDRGRLAWQPQPGVAYQLDTDVNNDPILNDLESYWCPATILQPVGYTGTPGAPNTSCP